MTTVSVVRHIVHLADMYDKWAVRDEGRDIRSDCVISFEFFHGGGPGRAGPKDRPEGKGLEAILSGLALGST